MSSTASSRPNGQQITGAPLTDAATSKSAGMATVTRRIAPPTLLAVAVVAAWWVVATLLNSVVVPTPAESLQSLRNDLASARFQGSVLDTLRVLAMSFALAVGLGTVLGVTVGLSPFWGRVLLPLGYALNSVPKIPLFPICLLFLGLGDLSRGAFALMTGVFPMFLVAAEATRGVPRTYLKLAASLRLSKFALLTKIVLPAVLPPLASGLKLTFGFTFLGLIIAEMFAGSSGLGQEMLRNVALVRMGNIVGEVLLVAAIALVPTLALAQVEERVAARFGGRS